ncbi:afln vera monooxygenase [Colletotrichum truncatum]|uniref:Afln vera monooxygenase n=1 Tax=Colletotrichum truncatum TaxID=5467 RepID=A0ACC3Z081_COLTU|nr:afln vera monooxygenase [Colletotrichum truncatum]KAF6800744.1 afln vera monooxygenase [Colletotrichum truncatum]
MLQWRMNGQQLQAAAIVAGASAFLYFLTRFYMAREKIRKMQRANLPMPKFSFFAGHFLVIGKIMRSLPSDSTIHNMMWQISKDYPKGIFYVCLWPFSKTTMVITDAHAASQLEGRVFAKGATIIDPLEKITGGKSLLTMDGEEWKRWRRLLSSGFSSNYMMGLAPLIADEVAVFRQKLLDRCSQGRSEMFQLEDLTMRLTFDVIGSVVLDTKFCHQIQDHPLAATLRKQIQWTSFKEPLSPLTKLFTIRPLVQWFYGRQLDRHISVELEKRLMERAEHRALPTGGVKSRSKSIVSLFIDEYFKEVGEKEVEKTNVVIKKIITPQIRLFLFAGHETTSSTLLYCYHLLSKNQDVLSRVIAETTQVFGPNPAEVQDKIRKDPQLLNKTTYTTAFIKEVLRIFAPSGSMRQGRQDTVIIDQDGKAHPTVGCNVWTVTQALHHNPRYWKDPELCIPERWLVGPEDPLYPPKGAWRPFEWGPRNCIGQTLAMIELKVALVMTVREFSFTAAYEEWDKLHPTGGIKTVDGERVYQSVEGGGGARPADGFPVRIELRKSS